MSDLSIQSGDAAQTRTQQEPSVAKKIEKNSYLFGLFETETPYYEFTTREGKKLQVSLNSNQCYSGKYASLFESFRKYSTSNDPEINPKEKFAVLKDLLKIPRDGGAAYSKDLFGDARKTIMNFLDQASSEESEGGKNVTLDEQRDIMEAWISLAGPNLNVKVKE